MSLIVMQEGFGAFGAEGSIPSVFSGAGTFDFLVQYVQAIGEPVRLKSLMVQALNLPIAGGPGAYMSPYFIATGPLPQDPNAQAIQPVPLILFSNTFAFGLPTLQILAAAGNYTCWEAGLLNENPWWEANWEDWEIIAKENEQLVVAVGVPENITAAPSPSTTASSYMTVLGYQDPHQHGLPVDASSLARYALSLDGSR